MSGLEVLGGVCAVFQTVSFTREVVSLCYKFYDNKHVAFDQLQQHADGMSAAVDSIKKRTVALQASSAGDEADLINVLKRAGDTTEKLKKEVAYVLEKRQSGSVSGALRTYFRYAKKKDAVAVLKSEMEDCDRLVKLILANRDARSLDAISFQMSTEFTGLSDYVKALIQDVAKRQQESEDAARENQRVLRADLVDLTGHVTESHIKTRSFVDDRISQRAIAESDAQAHKQLIDSLYFPDMWHRHNRIDLDKACFDKGFLFRDTKTEETDVSDSNSGVSGNESDVPDGDSEVFDSDSEVSDSDSDDLDSRKSSTDKVKEAIAKLRTWIDTGTTLFWISGYAGSGKSTLVRFLADQERKHAKANPVLRKEVLVHYFWRASSSEMQMTKFGCFCCLVHQILQNEQQRCQTLLAMYPEFAQKRNPRDWSNSELQQAFRYLVKASPATSFVVFIDGLDEIADIDELFPVLDMVDLQSKLANARFCVSSRPEFILKQRLQQYPTIRVQDLTFRGMLYYTKKKLRKPLDDTRTTWTTYGKSLLHYRIVGQSDGIFLWLVLVTDIIRQSLIIGEAEDKVLERLHRLPSKLEPLFTKMWERMGVDFASNQKLAATLINLTVVRAQVATFLEMSTSTSGPRRVFSRLIPLLLAAHPEEAEKLFGAGGTAPMTEQLAWVEARQREIDSVCMGLLVSKPARSGVHYDDKRLVNSPLINALEQSVSFVHRSAFDYFNDTDQGQQICSKSELSYDAACISLAKAYALVERSQAMVFCFSVLRPGSILGVSSYGFFEEAYIYAANLISRAVAYRYNAGTQSDVRNILGLLFSSILPPEEVAEQCKDLVSEKRHRAMFDVLYEGRFISPDVASEILHRFNIAEDDLDYKLYNPTELIVERMIELGAEVDKAIAGPLRRSKGCVSLFLERYWSWLPTLRYRILSMNVLAVLDVLLKAKPRLDVSFPLFIKYADSPDGYWPNKPAYIVTGKNLWLFHNILVLRYKRHGPSSLLADVKRRLVRLQREQGLCFKHKRASTY